MSNSYRRLRTLLLRPDITALTLPLLLSATSKLPLACVCSKPEVHIKEKNSTRAVRVLSETDMNVEEVQSFWQIGILPPWILFVLLNKS